MCMLQFHLRLMVCSDRNSVLRGAGLLLWLWSLPAMATGCSVSHHSGLRWLFRSMRQRQRGMRGLLSTQHQHFYTPLPALCIPHHLKAKELRRRSPGPQSGQSSTTAAVVLSIAPTQGAPLPQAIWTHLQ